VTGLRRALVPLLALAVLAGACTDDDEPADDADTSVEVEDVLVASADDVIVPSYEALVTSFDELSSALDELCAAPSPEALETARDAWREVAIAWRHTRAGGVGPAMTRRLAATIAFAARPAAVEELLAGSDPVTEAAVDADGAGVKGIVALEIGLFGDGSDELAAAAGARRCEYLTSVTALGRAASADVLADWADGYRDELIEGMDGDPQASLDALVNEVIFRLTETDDQGLRALTEAATAEELQPARADGPAAFHLAELRATYESVTAILDEGELQSLVEATNADTGERLAEAADTAAEAMAALPDSVTASFDDPDTVAEAQAAVMALKVLLSTEVASELGITLGFSDSDGDS